MISNPHTHQEIHVFLDKIRNTSKLSGVKAMIIFEFYRIQINLDTFSAPKDVRMRWEMVISEDSHIVTISSSVKYRDHFSSYSEYTLQHTVLSKT